MHETRLCVTFGARRSGLDFCIFSNGSNSLCFSILFDVLCLEPHVLLCRGAHVAVARRDVWRRRVPGCGARGGGCLCHPGSWRFFSVCVLVVALPFVASASSSASLHLASASRSRRQREHFLDSFFSFAVSPRRDFILFSFAPALLFAAPGASSEFGCVRVLGREGDASRRWGPPGRVFNPSPGGKVGCSVIRRRGTFAVKCTIFFRGAEHV